MEFDWAFGLANSGSGLNPAIDFTTTDILTSPQPLDCRFPTTSKARDIALDIATAQAELRDSYVHGGPGAIISGLVWLIAGVVAANYGIPYGFAALFFGGLFAAWLLMPYQPGFVFPLASIAVGAHYFGFRTAYGDTTYWVLGSVMCAIGIAAILAKVPSWSAVPFVIAAIEIAFGLWLSWVEMSEKTAAPGMSK